MKVSFIMSEINNVEIDKIRKNGVKVKNEQNLIALFNKNPFFTMYVDNSHILENYQCKEDIEELFRNGVYYYSEDSERVVLV